MGRGWPGCPAAGAAPFASPAALGCRGCSRPGVRPAGRLGCSLDAAFGPGRVSASFELGCSLAPAAGSTSAVAAGCSVLAVGSGGPCRHDATATSNSPLKPKPIETCHHRFPVDMPLSLRSLVAFGRVKRSATRPRQATPRHCTPVSTTGVQNASPFCRNDCGWSGGVRQRDRRRECGKGSGAGALPQSSGVASPSDFGPTGTRLARAVAVRVRSDF